MNLNCRKDLCQMRTVYTPIFPYMNALTEEECDRILAYANTQPFGLGTIAGDETSPSEYIPEARDCTVLTMENNDDTAWIRERLMGVVNEVNEAVFGLDITHLGNLNLNRYTAGHHQSWHTDTELMAFGAHRKLSASLFLSDPKDYEGGELFFRISHPDRQQAYKLPKGSVCFFYSHLAHQVAPVTSGQRDALVVWGMGPKLR